MRVPKKSSGVLREGGAEVTRKYETIHRQEHSYPVALMCQWAGVPEVRLLQLAQQAGVGDYHQKTQTDPFHQD